MTVTIDAVSVLWVAVTVLAAAVAFMAWKLRAMSEAEKLDRVARAGIGMDVQALQKMVFGIDSKVDKINVRLVDIETDRNTPPPMKPYDADDPLGFPQSWNNQAAMAERAAGVRV